MQYFKDDKLAPNPGTNYLRQHTPIQATTPILIIQPFFYS